MDKKGWFSYNEFYSVLKKNKTNDDIFRKINGTEDHHVKRYKSDRERQRLHILSDEETLDLKLGTAYTYTDLFVRHVKKK